MIKPKEATICNNNSSLSFMDSIRTSAVSNAHLRYQKS